MNLFRATLFIVIVVSFEVHNGIKQDPVWREIDMHLHYYALRIHCVCCTMQKRTTMETMPFNFVAKSLRSIILCPLNTEMYDSLLHELCDHTRPNVVSKDT